MTLRRAEPYALAAVLALAGGCKKTSTEKKTAAVAVSSNRLTPASKTFCRVLTLSGSVSRDGKKISVGTRVDGRAWLKLAPGAKLSLRHSASAREFLLNGPALVLACPRGLEQVVLGNGEFKAAPGLGARPGAQVIVATPFGNVRYGNAQLDVKATASGVHVSVDAGDVWVDPIGSAVRKGPEHLSKGLDASLSSPTPVSADARVAACRGAAQRAATQARNVLAAAEDDGGGSLGSRAAADVRARETARLACAAAEAAVGLTADPAKRHALWALLERSDRLWRLVPQPTSKRGR